ncbi:hypothetical protein F2P81_000636 [Scophthalmus maximus]|uniref:Uncharacterized protein n=1 Tax=Scophthalmus maximus TaxID=52904 RepID=A0A6A4TLL4_SCOMX|nr:hypothetical protein F2P81_000636 [Scophthalmus maximus]
MMIITNLVSGRGPFLELSVIGEESCELVALCKAGIVETPSGHHNMAVARLITPALVPLTALADALEILQPGTVGGSGAGRCACVVTMAPCAGASFHHHYHMAGVQRISGNFSQHTKNNNTHKYSKHAILLHKQLRLDLMMLCRLQMLTFAMRLQARFRSLTFSPCESLLHRTTPLSAKPYSCQFSNFDHIRHSSSYQLEDLLQYLVGRVTEDEMTTYHFASKLTDVQIGSRNAEDACRCFEALLLFIKNMLSVCFVCPSVFASHLHHEQLVNYGHQLHGHNRTSERQTSRERERKKKNRIPYQLHPR